MHCWRRVILWERGCIGLEMYSCLEYSFTAYAPYKVPYRSVAGSEAFGRSQGTQGLASQNELLRVFFQRVSMP